MYIILQSIRQENCSPPIFDFTYFSVSFDWLNPTLILSFNCWPTSSVGFDRPFHTAHEGIFFLSIPYMRKTFSSPFAVEREGDAFARAGSVCPVCQPLFVLPPLFDSNLVELLNTYRSSLHDSAFSIFIVSSKTIFYPRVALTALINFCLFNWSKSDSALESFISPTI